MKVPIERLDWNIYFLGIAKAVATRASCPRASVGAVIVGEDHRILSTGYNGAPSGSPHCYDEGCLIYENHCRRALHAEFNAVSWCSRSMDRATVYIYDSKFREEPCPNCQSLLKAAGITKAILTLQKDCRQYIIVPFSRIGSPPSYIVGAHQDNELMLLKISETTAAST